MLNICVMYSKHVQSIVFMCVYQLAHLYHDNSGTHQLANFDRFKIKNYTHMVVNISRKYRKIVTLSPNVHHITSPRVRYIVGDTKLMYNRKG